jgi:hypothetical protein
VTATVGRRRSGPGRWLVLDPRQPEVGLPGAKLTDDALCAEVVSPWLPMQSNCFRYQTITRWLSAHAGMPCSVRVAPRPGRLLKTPYLDNSHE